MPHVPALLTQTEVDAIAGSIEALSHTLEEVLDDQKEMQRTLISIEVEVAQLLKRAEELSGTVRGDETGLVKKVGVLQSEVKTLKESLIHKETAKSSATANAIAMVGVVVAILVAVVGIVTNPSCQGRATVKAAAPVGRPQ